MGPRHRPEAVHRLDAVRAARWNDQTVGVLNVQTEQRRDFSAVGRRPPPAIADLLAGIVEKGRQQREAEARATELKAIDEARSELIALVTHELRTPLAVVRAYTDLLAEDPPLEGRESRDPERRDRRAGWHRSTMEQVERLDRLVDSILASVRVGPEQPARLQPDRRRRLVGEVVGRLAPLLARHRLELAPGIRLLALTDPPRLRQILEHLVENAVKYAPPETTITIDWRMVEGGVRDRRRGRGPGHPRGVARADLRAVRPTRHAHGARLGHRAVRGASGSPSRWARGCGASRRRPTGTRFVVALPAAAAV